MIAPPATAARPAEAAAAAAGGTVRHVPPVRRAVLPQAPAACITVLGALLQPAELRVGAGGTHTVVRLIVAQAGELPPLCAHYYPAGGASAYVVWRQLVHDYGRGKLVSIKGRGLRLRTLHGRRVLALDSTESVRLMEPPFDARRAAAGDEA